MAFTGDLEQLHIVDIIQLLNTTRKSGTFSVKGSKGESRIIFSNGYIVGASHLDKVRIGTVLVKMGAITAADLGRALDVQKKAGKDRKPLIATLIGLGKLGHDEAFRGLRKLIEITMVELIGWARGTFTLDSDVIPVSPECNYPLSKMDQEISLDAQMVLMDALRIFDERERDRQSGKTVLSDEELFADVISPEVSSKTAKKASVLTAEDLGLGDLDRLERKIPQTISVHETFDPSRIHRQKIRETLADFSDEEQEAFASFLEKSAVRIDARDASQRPQGRARALILLSGDELIKHSVMTICKDGGVMVFATDSKEELDRIIAQCLTIKILPILVFDDPAAPETAFPRDNIDHLRQKVRETYPQLCLIQFASSPDYALTLESLRDGVRTVFPKPSKKNRKATFIGDTIKFLEAFNSYIKALLREQKDTVSGDANLGNLKDRILALRTAKGPSAVPLALLHHVAEICERSITFIVRPAELAGDKAIGVYAEKSAGPTSVTRLKVPLSTPSLFRDVVEKGRLFYGESNDEVLRNHLFEGIGEPLRPTIILLPIKSHGKTVTLTYGDFGGKEVSPVQSEVLEILANEAGLVLENTLYRRQLDQASRK